MGASTSTRSAETLAERRARADRKLAAIARRQFGVFSIGQASAAGLPRTRVERRTRSGTYRRLGPGILQVSGAPDGKDVRRMAALLHYGGDAVLARTTAAEVHGLEHRLGDQGLHLLVSMRTFTPRPGTTVHRSAKLTDADVTSVGPLRVTSPTWTVTDLAGMLDPDPLRTFVSAAVRGGQTDAGKLRELMARRGRFRGRAALRRIVDELSPLEPASRSELESLFVRVTSGAGIPPSAINHPISDGNGDRRVLDAVYLPERLPVELDSRAFHGTLLDWTDDLRRENAIKLAGWRDPLRFTHADLRERPDEVVEVLRSALRQARAEA